MNSDLIEANGFAPILEAMESWRDAGVFDAPARIDMLAKSIGQVVAENKALKAELRGFKELLASQVQVAETLQEVTKSLHAIAANKSQVQLMLPAEVGGKLEVGPQNVHVNPIIKMDAPQVHVPTEGLVKSLAELVFGMFAPVLKTISERPEPQAPNVDVAGAIVEMNMAPVAKAIDDLRELVTKNGEPQPPPPPVDLTPLNNLADAVNRQAKAVEKAIDAMKPQDLAPILKRLDEQGERIDKSLGSIADRPQPRQKRISQDPDTGDLIVTQE